MTPLRVWASPWLIFRHMRLRSKGPIDHDRQRQLRLSASLNVFFSTNSPEMVNYLTFLIFQCWCLNDCKIKAEVTDKDLAEFLDQLNDLVRSVYRYHQRDRYGKTALTIPATG